MRTYRAAPPAKPVSILLLVAILALAALIAAPPARAATINVNGNGDTIANDDFCTLREAIIAANTDTASGADEGECVAGSGADTITFDANYTITLGSQLPAVTSAITITGNGAANTIIQANAAPLTATYRVFEVVAAGNLTLDGVTVRHGRCTTGSCANSTAIPSAESSGGGILVGAGSTLTVANSTISDNNAISGGGILSNGGTINVTNSTLSGNVAGSVGGGIRSTQGTLTVTGSTLSGNSAGVLGGGIASIGGPLRVTDSILSGNLASGTNGSGAGIANQIAPLTVTNSTLSGNTASLNGGGIYHDTGTLTVTDSTLSGNNATAGDGGGIYNFFGTLTVGDSTLSGNSAGQGGGIYNGATLTVRNSTLSGNSATTDGGNIANIQSNGATLINSTVSDGQAANGGNLFTLQATTTLHNTIVANSLGGGDCVTDTGQTDAGNSLIEDGLACVNGTSSNNLTGDPNLGPLQDNGGPTETRALLAGSPAIDTGDNALAVDASSNPLATDQRGTGFPRINGGTVDMGAFESEAGPTVVDPCPAVPGNLIDNYCFEDGRDPWQFFTNGEAAYEIGRSAYQGEFAAEISIIRQGGNVQLYQEGFTLQPDTEYELSFAARSSNGNDLSVYVHEHDGDFTNYGLNNFVADLTPGWQLFQTTFTTRNFSSAVNDARLRFWLAPFDANGMSYHIDWVVLRELDPGNPIPPDPPVIVPPAGDCALPLPANLLDNPSFEAGTQDWSFYTNGRGTFATSDADPYDCQRNALIRIQQQGGNVQLYQQPLSVQGGQEYLLRLAARSSGGQDAQLFLHKHGAPYTNYGLNGVTLDLSTDWQVFDVLFTVVGSAPLNDARLRLWLAPFDANGAAFEFDALYLVPSSTVFPTSTATALPGESAAAAGTTARQARGGGNTAVQLRQGGFLDGDEFGRLTGGFVTGLGPAWCGNARPSRETLLNANGRFAPVMILGAGPQRGITVTGISQDEPVGEQRDGYLAGSRAFLRAERDEAGNGRVYHIAFTANLRGNVCSGEVVVNVPVDRRTEVIDNGAPYYDSTRAE